MRRVALVEFVVLGLSAGLAPAQALAQSVDIPLNYAINTGHNFGGRLSSPVLILTINVGINGGAAQPYAFDTGSAVFLAPSSAFSAGTSTTLASGVNIDTYGGSSTFAGNVYRVTVPSLKFYATPGATTGGISLGTGATAGPSPRASKASSLASRRATRVRARCAIRGAEVPSPAHPGKDADYPQRSGGNYFWQ